MLAYKLIVSKLAKQPRCDRKLSEAGLHGWFGCPGRQIRSAPHCLGLGSPWRVSRERRRAIGENLAAEFEVTLGEDGVDGGHPELLRERQDGGVNVAGARQLLAQPLYLPTLRDGERSLRHLSNCSL
jgi:hypothetical protein